MVLLLFAALCLQQLDDLLDLLVRDVDALAHLIATHLAHQQFPPDLLTKLSFTEPISGGFLFELLDGHLLIGGNRGYGLIELGIADFQTLAIGQLDDQTLADQPIQRLLAQLTIFRQWLVVAGCIALHLGDQAVELTCEHHILIDDGNDLVQRY